MAEPMDLARAKAIVETWEPSEEWNIQPVYFESVGFINGWNAAIREAAQMGNGIIVYSPEATNLVTTIHNKILSLHHPDRSEGKK